MLQRLKFTVSYFLFWVIYFVIAKLIFLLYHYERTTGLEFLGILKVFLFGLRLDASFAAYLSLLPCLVIAFSVFTGKKTIARLIHLLTFLFLCLVTLMTVIDLELFRTWGFRLDTTLLMYTNSPVEMWASAASSPIWLLSMVLIVLFLCGWWGFSRMVGAQIDKFRYTTHIGINLLSFVGLVLAAALLIIPLRGGLQLAPVNQASVYFSQDAFANQAAVNAPWNFFHAVSEKEYDQTNPYRVMEPQQADAIVKNLYAVDSTGAGSLLRMKRPNIILVIWESLTAKAVAKNGMLTGITPRFDSLVHEGIYFENFYANGNRSDKGLMAILSGYPAQPTKSIITIPRKTRDMPALSRVLSANGYQNSFYYGGELEFANIRSYLSVGNYTKIVSKADFEAKDWNSKWGAHDHIVFNRLLKDTPDGERNFFKVIFTLSSHEPFEVPFKSNPDLSDPRLAAEDKLFLQAHHYTDQALGSFIDEVKKRKWWNETLVIIVADHGHLLPFLGNTNHFEKQNFKIPMLWLGGALAKKDTTISAIGSQTDIAPTLLNQFGINSRAFRWGKDLLSPHTRPFAHYVFHDGFGFINRENYFLYDNVARRPTIKQGSDAALDTGKALLQMTYEDFLKR